MIMLVYLYLEIRMFPIRNNKGKTSTFAKVNFCEFSISKALLNSHEERNVKHRQGWSAAKPLQTMTSKENPEGVTDKK